MKEPFIKADPSFFAINAWQTGHPRLVTGFTTRDGGVSKEPYDSLNFGLHTDDRPEDVIKNRELLAGLLHVPLEQWVLAEQVHSNRVAVVTEADSGKGTRDYHTSLTGMDGLITNRKNILLAAFFADCVPLFFFDPETELIGIAHAGWKGTVQNIAGEMIGKLAGLGARKENIMAAIGPSISGGCYEVDDSVISQIDIRHRTAAKEKENGRYLLDLRRLNAELLKEHGLAEAHISITQRCTLTDEAHFYSYRRDQGRTGRMLGFIGWQPE